MLPRVRVRANRSAPALTAGVETREQVMALGVYHFTPGGGDYVENRVDDRLSPRHQTEFAAPSWCAHDAKNAAE